MWGKGNNLSLLFAVPIAAITMDINVDYSKARNRFTMMQTYHSYILRQKYPVYHCSLLFYSEYPGNANDLDVYHLINGNSKQLS